MILFYRKKGGKLKNKMMAKETSAIINLWDKKKIRTELIKRKKSV